ncbi:MFS transporter [bacterium SCSIO 12741]|nr:MFS transporter [bacterium SCSIO 12741]
MGDALLYPILPIYGKEMGFSFFAIGLLLSINRFVRIVANSQVAIIMARVGARKVLIFCSVLAVMTTLVYGLQVGLILFVLARLVWGLCYSGLQISTLHYAAQETQRKGLTFALAQSIKTSGALAVFWFGPPLVNQLGVEPGIWVIALFSSIGIVLSFFLPMLPLQNQDTTIKTKRTFYPSAINLLVFSLSFIIDGVMVVSLAQILGTGFNSSGELLVAVAFYLLLKKLFAVVVSLLSGFIALKMDPVKLYGAAILICVLALFLMAFNQPKLGIVLAFLFNSIIVTFSPLVALELDRKRMNSLQVISNISTWWDLGAAMGALLGIYLVEISNPQGLFGLAALVILCLSTWLLKSFQFVRSIPSHWLWKKKF